MAHVPDEADLDAAAPTAGQGASFGAVLGIGADGDGSRRIDDAFMMLHAKVIPCSRPYPHDWARCPFAHHTDGARRRDPRLRLPTTAAACHQLKKEGRCIKGDACPFSHSIFEQWLHPTKYRTQLCKKGAACRRSLCFFAHLPQEVREPCTWEELEQQQQAQQRRQLQAQQRQQRQQASQHAQRQQASPHMAAAAVDAVAVSAAAAGALPPSAAMAMAARSGTASPLPGLLGASSSGSGGLPTLSRPHSGTPPLPAAGVNSVPSRPAQPPPSLSILGMVAAQPAMPMLQHSLSAQQADGAPRGHAALAPEDVLASLAQQLAAGASPHGPAGLPHMGSGMEGYLGPGLPAPSPPEQQLAQLTLAAGTPRHSGEWLPAAPVQAALPAQTQLPVWPAHDHMAGAATSHLLAATCWPQNLAAAAAAAAAAATSPVLHPHQYSASRGFPTAHLSGLDPADPGAAPMFGDARSPGALSR